MEDILNAIASLVLESPALKPTLSESIKATSMESSVISGINGLWSYIKTASNVILGKPSAVGS